MKNLFRLILALSTASWAIAAITPLNNAVLSGFTLATNSPTTPPPSAGCTIQIVGVGAPVVDIDSVGAGDQIQLRRTDGSYASPSAVQNGDNFGTVSWNGYTGSAYAQGGYMAGYATQNWNNGATGTEVHVATTPNGSTTRTTAAIFGQDQSLTEYGPITANLNAAAAPGLAGAAGQLLADYAATDSTVGDIFTDGFGSPNQIIFRRSLGTNASKTAIQTGYGLGNLGWTGYNGSAYVDGPPALIGAVAEENWSGITNGTGLQFWTTASSGGTRSQKVHIFGSGGLTLGNSIITTDPGAGSLLMNGILNVNNSGGTPALLPAGTISEIAGTPASNVRQNIDAYAGIPVLDLRRADGTIGSPSAVQNAEDIGEIGFLGYKATGYSSTQAFIIDQATQNWTDTAAGNEIIFAVTPNNSIIGVQALILGQDQSATFFGAITGATSITSTGNIQTNSGNLIAAGGNLSVSGTSALGGTVTVTNGLVSAGGSATAGTYESFAPIYVAVKGVTLLTATTPANLFTIVLPAGITRYFIPAASSIQCYAETAAGTLAAGTIQLRTATSGGGSQIGSTITPPASAGAMTTTAGSDTAVQTATTIYGYQTGNSGNAGTVSVYIKLVPIL